MAIEFVDGWDHYATTDLTKKWSLAGSSASIGTDGRRGGGNLSTSASSQGFVTKTLVAKASRVVGVAFKYPGAINGAPTIIALLDSGTLQCELRLNASGTLSVTRNGTAVTDGTSAVSLAAGTYYYVELEVTIANSIGAGTCRVWLNGAVIITVATGQDLQNTANAQANQVRLGSASSTNSAAMSFDDFYVADTTGTTNNGPLGDVRIDTIFPNAAGTHQDWTPSTGTDHAAVADEIAPNTTDYLTGGAAGTKETLGLQDLAINGAILGIQVNNAVAKSDAGACTIKNLIRSGTSEESGAPFAPSTDYLYSSSIHETDPATGSAWLTAAINALEAGAEVVS